jgi:hypothetical protein
LARQNKGFKIVFITFIKGQLAGSNHQADKHAVLQAFPPQDEQSRTSAPGQHTTNHSSVGSSRRCMYYVLLLCYLHYHYNHHHHQQQHLNHYSGYMQTGVLSGHQDFLRIFMDFLSL